MVSDKTATLEAIIAHERGHQLLDRDERLLRVRPSEMSETTEEVLASLLGALLVNDPRDSKMLELKAICELVDRGIKPSEASLVVEANLELLRRAL